MVNCSIIGCKSRNNRNQPNITFHRFPREPIHKTKWIESTGRVNWQPSSHARICSRHFVSNCFKPSKNDGYMYLRPHSVPTLFIQLREPGDNEKAMAQNLLTIQNPPKTETYFGQCRCCLDYAYLKDMWAEHLNDEKREILGKILVDCFNITWTILDQIEDDRMCDECISKMQDAVNFKNQVLKAQEDLIRNVSLQEDEKVSGEGGLKLKFESDIDTDNESYTEEVMEDHLEAFNDENEFDNVKFLDEGIIDDDDLNENEKIEPTNSTVKNLKKSKKKPKSAKVKKKGSDINPPCTELRDVNLDVDYKVVNRKYQCCHCNKLSTWFSVVQRHINAVHFKTPRYTCKECPEMFVYRESLLGHEIKFHNRGEKFQCDSCSAVYCWKNKLIRHIKERHLLNKLYKCDKCTYKSYIYSQFARHKVEHTLEKKYHCSFCKKSFKKSNTLKDHEKIHRGEKPHACCFCQQAFVQKCSLKYHMRKYHPEISF